jgi:hypothetical protein
MKTRIFGSLLVLAILVALFVLTGGDHQNPSSSTVQSQPAPPSSADNDLKNLKIN